VGATAVANGGRRSDLRREKPVDQRTLTGLDDEDERAFNTDGRPLRGVEVKVVDFDGRDMPLGKSGRLLVRACSNFGGLTCESQPSRRPSRPPRRLESASARVMLYLR
jgi:hypothetical protein